jgi:hypothetical protein
MKKRLTLIGTVSFILIGFGLFAAPAFAATVSNASDVVTNTNASGLLFLSTALGLFGVGVGII